MFVDEKTLLIHAGKGGDGASLFRREKYVPRGGPDGGDGGNGGDVYVVGARNLHALTHLAHATKIVAEDGMTGGHKRSTGKSGEDVTVSVPLGTLVVKLGETETNLCEITEEGQRVRIAKGGNGGWGNWHFRSSIQQAPDRANAGHLGEEFHVRFVLKLIADIGLVGLPNAGKSTLLSTVSAARPKIANYPFTTLEPQLGVAQVGKRGDEHQVVIADLPGLIEGASGGKGLGIAFLKHVERTKAIVHCIDCSLPLEELEHNYHTIRKELETFSATLAAKDELVCLTKRELISEDELADKMTAMRKITGQDIIAISAATNEGITDLLTRL